MKLRLNHWFPKYFLKPFGFEAITLFPYVLIAGKTTSIHVARHEFQHLKQIKEHGLYRFYYLYIKEFVVNLYKYGSWSSAYWFISFEREARLSEIKIYDQDFLDWLEEVVKEMEFIGLSVNDVFKGK